MGALRYQIRYAVKKLPILKEAFGNNEFMLADVERVLGTSNKTALTIVGYAARAGYIIRRRVGFNKVFYRVTDEPIPECQRQISELAETYLETLHQTFYGRIFTIDDAADVLKISRHQANSVLLTGCEKSVVKRRFLYLASQNRKEQKFWFVGDGFDVETALADIDDPVPLAERTGDVQLFGEFRERYEELFMHKRRGPDGQHFINHNILGIDD